VSVTQRKSEFEKWILADRPAIEKVALALFFCAKLSLDAGMARVLLPDLCLQIQALCASRLSVLL